MPDPHSSRASQVSKVNLFFEVKGVVSYLEALHLRGFPVTLVVCLHFWAHWSDLQHSYPLGWPFYRDHSWAGFISAACNVTGNKMPSSSNKALKETWLTLFCWWAEQRLHPTTCYITALHTPSSFPPRIINSKGYLQFIEALPRRSAFPGAICEKEHSHP